jgi:hypothetical protein
MGPRHCYLPHLTTDWADPPIAGWHVIETGFRTHRSVRVSRLELWVVETSDAYDPTRLNAYPTMEDALDAAERVMADPDSRGVMREWVPDGEPPSESDTAV